MRAWSRTRYSSSTVCGRNALRTSGRSKATRTVPESTWRWYVTSVRSKPSTGFHAAGSNSCEIESPTPPRIWRVAARTLTLPCPVRLSSSRSRCVTRFRGITTREGMLLRRTRGLGRVLAVLGLHAGGSRPWLGAAREAADEGWPDAGAGSRAGQRHRAGGRTPSRAAAIVPPPAAAAPRRSRSPSRADPMHEDLDAGGGGAGCARDRRATSASTRTRAWDVDTAVATIKLLDAAAGRAGVRRAAVPTLDELAAVRRADRRADRRRRVDATRRRPAAGRPRARLRRRRAQGAAAGWGSRCLRVAERCRLPSSCRRRWRRPSGSLLAWRWPPRCLSCRLRAAWRPCSCSRTTSSRNPCCRLTVPAGTTGAPTAAKVDIARADGRCRAALARAVAGGGVNPSQAFAPVFVDELMRGGVVDAVLSPGSRSAPLALRAVRGRRCTGGCGCTCASTSVRPAFLALGLAKASRPSRARGDAHPGTAAANLHAAVLEASHASVPLVVLTADRPPELRGVGANQATEQIGLYGTAVRFFREVGAAEERIGQVAYWRALVSRTLAAATGSLSRDPGPVHLNVALREPLIPSSTSDWVEPLAGRGDAAPWASAAPLQLADAALSAEPRTLVIVGDVVDRGVGSAAAALATSMRWPVIAEPSSGAWSAGTISPLLLSDADVGCGTQAGAHLGGRPPDAVAGRAAAAR